MKSSIFSISKSIMTPAQMQPCTPELLNAALDSQQVLNACQEIAQHLAEVKRGTLTREEFNKLKNKLKEENLPVICFHASFSDGYRHNQSAVPSGLSIYDVDHLELDPRAYYLNKVAGREVELGISFAHVSPSGEGIRLVFEIPQGMSLAEAQQWMAEQLNDETYDGSVKDLARCSFAVCRDYVLYYDEEELFKEREVSVPENPVTIVTNDSANFSSMLPESSDYEDNFNGISYQQIVRAMEEQLGATPAMGARNNFIFSMASHLRYVCNDDPRWIAQVLPRYGEEEDRFLSTVRSACNRPQTKSMPDLVNRALELARQRQLIEEAVKANGAHAAQPPQMPAKLTKFMRFITKNVPDHLKPAVAMGVFPSLGAHCKGVKFRYNDNALVEPTFMNVLVAEMSSGKSCVNEPINAIMADIKERDAESRKLMQEYKEQYDTCPSNEQKPERPKGLVVQWVKSDMTPAAFVQLMADAGGRFLYTQVDEVELFEQLKVNGKAGQIGKIFRLAYDCGFYGQERVGIQSVSGRPQMRWNWNASTTIQRGQRFFQSMLADGTLSRISFSTIRTYRGMPMPIHGYYDEKFAEELKPYIDRLNAAKGTIDLPQAQRLTRQLDKEAKDMAWLADDETYEKLSYRAVVSAWLRAMTLYLAEGKWSREIETLALWSFRYDMWCKMHFFGQQMSTQMAGEVVQTRGPKNMLDMLSDDFTREDAHHIRIKQGKQGSPGSMLCMWEKRGYIVRDNDGVYHKTPQYLKRKRVA